MKATDAIRTALTSTRDVITWYLSDLSDQDLLVRPAPGANHIAWQLGHLILAERNLVAGQLPGTPYPELPAGFAAQHDKGAASQDPPTGFGTKQQYLDLFTRSRQATLDAVARLSEDDLDRPLGGDWAKYAPTLGAFLLSIVANHTLMHGGQFTVVRRKLGKPVLF
jgi:hypothetical protein